MLAILIPIWIFLLVIGTLMPRATPAPHQQTRRRRSTPSQRTTAALFARIGAPAIGIAMLDETDGPTTNALASLADGTDTYVEHAILARSPGELIAQNALGSMLDPDLPEW